LVEFIDTTVSSNYYAYFGILSTIALAIFALLDWDTENDDDDSDSGDGGLMQPI
tara:strand:+ start:14255 stop:14416 length:162 start_codon:yes stop_codon:yes gene_type:complete